MKTITLKTATRILLLSLSIAFLPFVSSAQKKLQNNPGGYHGELDFPISWKRYYSYQEWTGIMHDLQKKYPALTSIESIGKSRMGRDQFLLTITNKETGSDKSKTAMWVDGAIHGNEVNGITCSLYTAWYLLTRYEYDPYVHELVDKYTFYILPGLNVDANESYVVWPNTENNPREPYRPEDNDGDGLFDEDQTEDVDGDGELSMMYKEDPMGQWRLSYDGRRFVAVEDNDFNGVRFTRIGQEGFDNDGDGLINEDDIGGPDPNRNFPYGWNLNDGNPYPMSEAETRNVFEFQLKHPNIFASFHFHNTGRLIMFQAPPPVKTSAQAQSQYEESVQNRLAEMKKSNKYAYLSTRQVAPTYSHDLDVQHQIVTEGAYLLKNYTPVIGGLSGQAHAATYYMLGAYSYLIELWGSPVFAADIDGDDRVSDEEFMKFLDLDLTGSGWIDPHTFDHPDLGKIWIGGSARKHIQRTPPARYIEMEAEKNAMFVMYCASQFPSVKIGDVNVKPLTDRIYQVDVVVRNDGKYPTSSDRSLQLKRGVKDKLVANLSSNIKLIPAKKATPDTEEDRMRRAMMGGGRGTSLLPYPEPSFSSGELTELRLKGSDLQVIRYLVDMNGKEGWIEFLLESERGGKDSKKITIKAQ